MIDLKEIPSRGEHLDTYETENIFHSWSYQPAQSPLRVTAAKGVRFTTEDGRERLDFSSCFVSHNIGHQDPRVVNAICEQANTLTAQRTTGSRDLFSSGGLGLGRSSKDRRFSGIQPASP